MDLYPKEFYFYAKNYIPVFLVQKRGILGFFLNFEKETRK